MNSNKSDTKSSQQSIWTGDTSVGGSLRRRALSIISLWATKHPLLCGVAILSIPLSVIFLTKPANIDFSHGDTTFKMSTFHEEKNDLDYATQQLEAKIKELEQAIADSKKNPTPENFQNLIKQSDSITSTAKSTVKEAQETTDFAEQVFQEIEQKE